MSASPNDCPTPPKEKMAKLMHPGTPYFVFLFDINSASESATSRRANSSWFNKDQSIVESPMEQVWDVKGSRNASMISPALRDQ